MRPLLVAVTIVFYYNIVGIFRAGAPTGYINVARTVHCDGICSIGAIIAIPRAVVSLGPLLLARRIVFDCGNIVGRCLAGAIAGDIGIADVINGN